MEFKHLLELIGKRKQIFWGVFASVIILSVCVAFFTPVTYQASSKVIIAKNRQNEALSGFISDNEIVKAAPNISKLASFIKDSAVVNEVIKSLDLRDKSGMLLLPSDLLKSIKIVPDNSADVILIKAEAGRAEDASNIANAFARQFVKWIRQINNAESLSYQQYIEAQFQKIKKYRVFIDEKMAKVKATKAPLPFGQDIQDQLSRQADAEIEKVKLNLLLNRARILMVTESFGVDSELIAKKLKLIDEAIAKAESVKSGLPSKSQFVYDLYKDSKIFNVVTPMLTQKLNEIRISSATKANFAEIVATAEPPRDPVRPQKVLDIVTGCVLGFLLAFSTVFLLDYFDHSIKSSDELIAFIEAPLLGQIPYLKVNTAAASTLLETKADPASILDAAVSKALSRITEMVKLSGNNTVAFASPSGDFGSSVVSALIAAAAARNGIRTLLIDMDVFDPMQHKLLKVNSPKGISGIINENAEVSPEVMDTYIPDLKILTAGGMLAEMPSISAEITSQILAKVTDTFDLIIADTPGLLTTGRSTGIFKAFGNTVLIIPSDEISKRDAIEAADEIKKAGALLLGFIFSSVKLEGEKHPLMGYTGISEKKKKISGGGL